MTINGHSFILRKEANDIDVTWTSYMNMEFTFRIEPATMEEEINTGCTHFMGLNREHSNFWEHIEGFEEPTTEDIYNTIRSVLFGFTRTY